MSFEVPKKLEREINRLVKNYPEKRSASLMVLHALQDEFGHISRKAEKWPRPSWSCSRSTFTSW